MPTKPELVKDRVSDDGTGTGRFYEEISQLSVQCA